MYFYVRYNTIFSHKLNYTRFCAPFEQCWMLYDMKQRLTITSGPMNGSLITDVRTKEAYFEGCGIKQNIQVNLYVIGLKSIVKLMWQQNNT